MSEPSQPPRAGKGRWLALAFVLALAGFTCLCWRDASRPPVRSVSGGTFVGQDVDGRLAYVNLFELEDGWQGWLYREGREQTAWFPTTNRTPPWQGKVHVREREEEPTPPAATVVAAEGSLRLNVTFPRTNGWASDTANLTRQFEHLSFRRRTGLRLGRFGGTKEFLAQFPKLPAGVPFYEEVRWQMLQHFETDAEEFTKGIFEHWKEAYEFDWPVTMSEWTWTENWQLRLLTTNVVSFCVWSYDDVGGNGNHSHWRGANFIATVSGLRELALAELLRPEVNWRAELRQRCLPKLAASGAPGRAQAAVTEPDTSVDVFTLSPTGLQIYFNPYAIASGADGEFVVHFDYAELKDLLRTDGPAALLPRTP